MRTATEDDGDGISSVGAHMRVPLLRDRGFAINRLEVETLSQEAKVAAYGYEAAVFDVLTDVTVAYAQYVYRVADGQEISNALVRAEQLVSEATTRAELQDIAEYQVFPAQYEAATREEELSEALSQVVLSRESLRYAIGTEGLDRTILMEAEDAYGFLEAWVEALETMDLEAFGSWNEAMYSRVPELKEAESKWTALLKRVGMTREEERASLDLNVGAGWRSEMDETSMKESGYAVSLVYSRPLSREGSRAKVGAAEMRAEAAAHEYEAAVLEGQVRHAKALEKLSSVKKRRALARATVAAARKVLESETERFAIGDGTSRAVLDAQNYLTTARRRELSVSLEVITSMAELFRASGVPVLGEKETN